MNSIIISLIISAAPMFDIKPEVALAVARTESSLNPSAIGPVGEVGIFQVRPEFSTFTAEQLKQPLINIQEGLRILSEAKKRCPHKESKTFVICFNRGITGGYKVKDPKSDKYYIKVMNRIADAN